MSSQLITPTYRDLLRKIHSEDSAFGTSAQHYADAIGKLMRERGYRQVLDYGCGKQELAKRLDGVIGYDPGIPECAAPPEPCDVVACIDVLEHIEPECLEAVLADLRRLTKKVAYVTIAHRESTKKLADGRNAHLLVRDRLWWLEQLSRAGFIVEWHSKPAAATSIALLTQRA
jgi:hypothetical protein